jgi:hypothetical protein
MLYIVSVNDSNRVTQTTWHVGEPKDAATFPHRKNTNFEVQADGDELNHILANFANVPRNHNNVQTWYGSLAKFIALNL